MASFEFGIGISVDGAELASKAIGSVIADVQGLQNSMASAAGVSLDQIFKGVDPTLLMPANEAIEDAANSLREIKGILIGLVGGAGAVTDALKEAPKVADETAVALEEVHEEVCGTTVCVEEVKEGLVEVKGATSDWKDTLREVPGLMDDIGTQAGNIHRAAHAITGLASELEYVSVRSEAALGRGRDAALDFGTAALETANRTRVSWEEVARLQVALRGVTVDFDTTTSAGRRQMDTMVLLSESFGMSEYEVARLAGTMKATGGNLEELAGIGVAFQKQFKVPGLLNQMPVAARAAMDAQATFGTLVGKSSKDITVNIMRMTGTYARALGVTAAEAARKAMGTFQKFTAEIESYEDLFLGLADDFSPLQTAFLETGMGLEDLQELMRKGQEDPAAFAEEVKRIRDSMDPQMGERFFRQVLRNTDEATRALLTQEAAAQEAMEASSGAGVEPEDPSAVFMSIANAMRETAVDALKQQDALKGVAVEMGKLAASEGIRKGVQMVNDVLQATNGVLLTQWNQLRHNTEAMEAFSSVIGGTTAALNGLSVAANAVGSIFSGTSAVFMGVASAAGMVLRPIMWLIDKLKIFKGTAAAAGAEGAAAASTGLKGFAKVIGKIAVPIGIAIAAFDNVVEAVKNVGAILSDPSASGMDKFKGVVKEVLGAVVGTIDDFFLGLPGKFVEGVMGTASAFDTAGAESFGQAVGNVLGVVIGAIGNFFGTTLPEAFDAGWNAIVAWWGGRSLWDVAVDSFLSLLTGVQAIGHQIIGFFKGVGAGIVESLGPQFEIAVLLMQKSVHGTINSISDTIMAAVSGWKLIFNEIGAFLDALWSGVSTKAQNAITGVVATAIEKVVGLAKENPVIAGLLGFGEEQVAGLESIANNYRAAAALAEEGHQANLKRIEAERVARENQIIAEQRDREEATQNVAAGYDAAIAERQRRLDEQAMRVVAPGTNAATTPPPTPLATSSDASSVVPPTAIPSAAAPTLQLPTGGLAEESVAQVTSRAGAPGAPPPGATAPGDRGGHMTFSHKFNVQIGATDAVGRALAEAMNVILASQNSQGAGYAGD